MPSRSGIPWQSASFLASIALFSLLILCLVLSCLFDCLIDIGIGHIGTRGNGDVLLFTCTKILCGYIYDTVCINIEGNLNLRNTSSCRKDAIQTELVPRVLLSFANCRSPCTTWISTAVWLSAAVEKIWLFLVGIVVFLSISLVATPPMVSMDRDSGVTSRRRISPAPASPASLPPWIAAPMATHSSGFKDLLGSLPVRLFYLLPVLPAYVWNRLPEVPCLSSEAVMPASFSAFCTGIAVLSIKSSGQLIKFSSGQVHIQMLRSLSWLQ